MSWMSFRTNLNRQQPGIISVGEIAQLIILHAELAVAAVREVSVWCSGCCWWQGEDELSGYLRLQWQPWPEGNRNIKPGPESLTFTSISSAFFSQNTPVIRSMMYITSPQCRKFQFSVQNWEILALYMSANISDLQNRADQRMSRCPSNEFFHIII